MNKKKIFLGIVALMLVCTLSVAGTLAYLTSQANDGEGVTNTFVAAGGGEMVETFELKEHAVIRQTDGSYILGTADAPKDAQSGQYGNDYEVLPGVELPKDPYITISGKTEAPAYLYVEIVGALDTAIFDWAVDTDNWTELTGVTGQNGGKVYVYKNSTIINNETTGLETINIIANNKVKVKNADTASIAEAGITLEFYGYMAQASIGTAAEAFEECF